LLALIITKNQILKHFYDVQATLAALGNNSISAMNLAATEIILPAKFFQDFSEDLLARCDMLLVVTMPGWKESAGVKVEIECAKRLGKPIIYFSHSWTQ